jgi:uncharacterized protein
MSPEAWVPQFHSYITTALHGADGAHDVAHVQRVVNTAVSLAATENADLAIVLPSAWLHDCVSLPKNAPNRAQASQLAATEAGNFLHQIGYPAEYIPAIQHAITAHSFSAGIPPQTIEAQVVQDADRLDALGAIGLARCILTGASFNSRLYAPDDPFAETRPCNDTQYMVDHFFTKLFHLQHTMQTPAGRAEANRRTTYMHTFLHQLGLEIGVPYVREQ